MASQEAQVISLLDKIKSLMHDRDKIVGRVGELQSLIAPKMETMFCALKKAQAAMVTNDLVDLQTAEMQTFLFSGHISVLECLKKGWDNDLNMLKNILQTSLSSCKLGSLFVNIWCVHKFLDGFLVCGSLPFPLMSKGGSRVVKNGICILGGVWNFGVFEFCNVHIQTLSHFSLSVAINAKEGDC